MLPVEKKGRYFMLKKKTLLIIPILLITLLTSLLTPAYAFAAENDYQPRLSAPSRSNAYYSSKLNVYFQSGYGMPNCVAYAYGRIYEMNGEAPKISRGSAGSWYSTNKRNGYYEYGQEPKVGAVACWSNHVAIVEKINNDGSITLSESHWGGRYFNIVTYSNMYSHYGQKFYGYIYTYNNGVSNELTEKLANAQPEANSQYKMEKSFMDVHTENTIMNKASGQTNFFLNKLV